MPVLHAVFYTVYHHYQTQSLFFVAMHNVVLSFSWARGNLRHFWHITMAISPCISKSGCISLKSHISESNAMQSPEIWYSQTLCNSNKSLISYPDASHPLILYAAVMPRDNIACHFLWWEPFRGRSPVLCNKTQSDRSIKMCSYVGSDDFHSVSLWNKAVKNTKW